MFCTRIKASIVWQIPPKNTPARPFGFHQYSRYRVSNERDGPAFLPFIKWPYISLLAFSGWQMKFRGSRKTMRSIARLACIMGVACAAAWAQTDQGRITGTVTDPTGAAVATA